MVKSTTVNLCFKGLARKANLPLRDNDLSPDLIFFSYSYISYKGISVHGKNLSGLIKSLREKFNCIEIRSTDQSRVRSVNSNSS